MPTRYQARQRTEVPYEQRGTCDVERRPDLPRKVDGDHRVVEQRHSAERDDPAADGVVVSPLLVCNPGADRADDQTQQLVVAIRPRQERRHEETGCS